MKLFSMIMSCAAAQECVHTCRVHAENEAECQKMCDTSSYCEVWTLRKHDKICAFKQRTGWVVEAVDGYSSGFKNQGPWFEPNTHFHGGDYICN